MCHNTLPVRGTLLIRGCHIDPQCPPCLTEIEKADHLFGDCPQTIRVWKVAQLHNWIPPHTFTPQSNDWMSIFKTLIDKSNGKILQRISFLLWSTWNMRNAVIFQQETFQPNKCLIRAKKTSAEWRIRTCMSVDDFHQGSLSTPPHKLQFIRWHPPTPGTVKLNFDGSLQSN